MYNGITGERMPGLIFIGPTYYQRLKHMVCDKVHARSRGPIQILTRQPVEGRSREGGLRFGEMERDCIISHGCSHVLSECMCDKSDAFEVVVCATCGLLCNPQAINTVVRNKRATCCICGDRGKPTTLKLPYAFKLLLQELMSISIAARLRIK